MRLDCHVHLWRYDPEQYAWIRPEVKVLQRDYLPDDLAKLQEPLGFDGAVAVQARQTVEETEFLLGLADEYDNVKGVVGWVDLRGDEVEAQLERFAEHPAFRGVRHVVQDEPDDRFIVRDDFVRGVRALTSFDLVYDILIYHRQLPATIEFVEMFPDQSFVINHNAKPDYRSGELEPWATHMRTLGGYPNVACKASGMVSDFRDGRWPEGTFEPYLDVVFEAFGTDRVMIASDWPVCLLGADYADTLGVVMDYIAALSDDEQAAVLGGNAQRIYGIES
ncbi:MAG: amidohydrolase family protein [Armatimonadetes bacterium]|nr:amidohydrolase family protein [Armatimonadota bacterium]